MKMQVKCLECCLDQGKHTLSHHWRFDFKTSFQRIWKQLKTYTGSTSLLLCVLPHDPRETLAACRSPTSSVCYVGASFRIIMFTLSVVRKFFAAKECEARRLPKRSVPVLKNNLQLLRLRELCLLVMVPITTVYSALSSKENVPCPS